MEKKAQIEGIEKFMATIETSFPDIESKGQKKLSSLSLVDMKNLVIEAYSVLDKEVPSGINNFSYERLLELAVASKKLLFKPIIIDSCNIIKREIPKDLESLTWEKVEEFMREIKPEIIKHSKELIQRIKKK